MLQDQPGLGRGATLGIVCKQLCLTFAALVLVGGKKDREA